MSDGMRRELVYLSSYATNRYFIPNWGNIISNKKVFMFIFYVTRYYFYTQLPICLALKRFYRQTVGWQYIEFILYN